MAKKADDEKVYKVCSSVRNTQLCAIRCAAKFTVISALRCAAHRQCAVQCVVFSGRVKIPKKKINNNI